jgi:hypothetical protein
MTYFHLQTSVARPRLADSAAQLGSAGAGAAEPASASRASLGDTAAGVGSRHRWENHRKTIGKPWENVGKPWENYRKM